MHNYYYLSIYTICGVGIFYFFTKKRTKVKPKLVDTSNWTIQDWKLYGILSIMILENPTMLKNVNKDSDAFKYFVEVRKHLNDKEKRKVILEELTDNNLLLK